MPSISFERLIALLRISTPITKRIPESGQPCLTPLIRLKCLVAKPLFKIELDILLYKTVIHGRSWGPKLKASRPVWEYSGHQKKVRDGQILDRHFWFDKFPWKNVRLLLKLVQAQGLCYHLLFLTRLYFFSYDLLFLLGCRNIVLFTKLVPLCLTMCHSSSCFFIHNPC